MQVWFNEWLVLHPEHAAYQNSLREIFKRINPRPKNILEFGTGGEGLSSTVFLEDKEIKNVISIDIEDYSKLINENGLILLDDLAMTNYSDSPKTTEGGFITPLEVFEAIMLFWRGSVSNGNDFWLSVDPRNHGWGFLSKKPMLTLQTGWNSNYR